ncbi:MAG: DNA polymerase III subunit alpha [Planctomycetes bacterium]|nr:DNA polymerase III subunit alpha [Planctomycetota bacterium]
MDFCHLHVHSDYSLLDGLSRVDELVKTCGQRGMSSIALTDHGSLAGSVHFYKAAKKAGIKPILGCEMYMAPGPRTDRKKDPIHNVASFHLTLLAKDLEGWHNLMELGSKAYTEGYYYNPRVDHELLAKHSKGVIALSGCLKGETSYYLRTGHEKKAYDTAAWYRDVFGEDYFVEIQRNGADGQEENNALLVKMARDLGLPIVCSNDVHYISREDAFAQEVRMAISTGKVLADEDRLKHKSEEFWLKGADEMWRLFPDFHEACDSTLQIASRCNVAMEFGKFHLPQFVPPDGKTPEQYFGELCERGLAERYGEPLPARAVERLRYEMGVITKMGFVSYFLIVWDFIRYAREHNIPVGPGRGSAAGSIVAYCLRITDVCPLKYDLLFERFLNSERISMPDIDIDFCRDGREQVIRYVTEKYGGQSNVTQIVTFGTLAARAVVRDVGRVLGVPLSEIDGLAKKIPNGPNDTLSQAIAGDPEVKQLRDDARYKELFDVSLRLEGINRHASTHAAGVVIGDGPLSRHVPVQKVGDDVVTAYTMDVLEEVGLLKMDFLGLKTLTVLDKAVKLIERTGGAKPDLDHLPFDDDRTWKLLQRGEALGVFQLESGGMRDLLTKLVPDRFEDLIAILALYRPGPLQSGMVDQFVRRKHGEEAVTYQHPALEPLLKDTYGTFVYQEQIMLVAQQLGGFTLNKADGLRKAMGKKNLEQMLKYKGDFVNGSIKSGADEATATQIWDVMQQFAEYAFNKSHTTAYAVVTYQTAWLKANHPVEFLAALMTCDMANTEKIVGAIEELRRMNIPLLAPDVNRSESDFTVEDHDRRKAIRFGLAAVKGLGHAIADGIVAARRAIEKRHATERRTGAAFATLADLCESVGTTLNKAALEPLGKSGALDSLLGPKGHRAQVFAGIEGAIRLAAQAHEDKRAGQMSLFGGAPAAGPATGGGAGISDLPEAARWADKEILAGEKESLGFYLSSHPLARHERTLRALSTAPTPALAKEGNGARVWLGGMVTQLKTLYPKSGKNMTRKMARFRVEDFEGSVACVMFADQFEKEGAALADEAIGFVEASIDLTRDEPDLRVERFLPVDAAYDELVTTVLITASEGEDARAVAVAKRLLADFPGKAKLMLALRPVPKVRTLYRVDGKGLRPCRELHDIVISELGPLGVQFKVKKPESRRQPWQGGGGGGGSGE